MENPKNYLFARAWQRLHISSLYVHWKCDLWHTVVTRLHSNGMLQTAVWVEPGITQHQLDTKSLRSHTLAVTLTHTLVRPMNGGASLKWHLTEALSEWRILVLVNTTPYMRTHKSNEMYKWSERRENCRTSSFSFCSTPRIPLPPPLNFSFPTHSPNLPRLPVSAFKYAMKYEECWHTAAVCVLPLHVAPPSLGCLSATVNACNWVTKLHQ